MRKVEKHDDDIFFLPSTRICHVRRLGRLEQFVITGGFFLDIRVAVPKAYVHGE